MALCKQKGLSQLRLYFWDSKKLLSTDIFGNNKTIEIDQTIIKDMFSFNYNDEMIRQYVFDNLIDGPKPKGFKKENIILANIKRVNKYIEFDVSLNNYFDDKGVVQTNGFVAKVLAFGIFKESTQTTISAGTHKALGQEEVLTEDYIDEMIRQFVFDHLITGTKPPVSQKELFIIGNIERDNGKIRFQISLKVCVNVDGEVKESTSISFITLTGFKVSAKIVNRIDDILSINPQTIINTNNK